MSESCVPVCCFALVTFLKTARRHKDRPWAPVLQDILLSFTVPPVEEPQDAFSVFHVAVSYTDLQQSATQHASAVLSVARCAETPLDMQPSLEVAVQRARIMTVRQVQQASAAADHGKHDEAGQMLLDWASRITALIAQEQHSMGTIRMPAVLGDSEDADGDTSDDDMGSCTTVESSDGDSSLAMDSIADDSAAPAATHASHVDVPAASLQRRATLEGLRSDVQLCAREVKRQAWKTAGRARCQIVSASHAAQRSPGVLSLQEDFDRLGLAAAPAQRLSSVRYSNHAQRAMALDSMQNVMGRLGLGKGSTAQ